MNSRELYQIRTVIITRVVVVVMVTVSDLLYRNLGDDDTIIESQTLMIWYVFNLVMEK